MGLNKRGKPKRFSRGWKVAWWGSVEKKEDSHFFGLSGSLHKLDHISRTAREDWTTEEALSGSGEEDQMARLSAYREAWAPRGKSLVMSSTNRMKRTGPSTEPWGTPRLMRKERLWEPPTWTLALRSERKERTQRTKQGGSLSERSLWKRAECHTESKALEKSTDVKMLWSGGFFFWKPSQIDWDRVNIWWRGDLPGRKPAWQVERRWFDSRWKVRRERIKRSKSLEMQEVREMGRKEDGEEVGFPGLWMGMIVVGFQQEGKVWECQDLLKRERRRSCAGSGRCFSKG